MRSRIFKDDKLTGSFITVYNNGKTLSTDVEYTSEFDHMVDVVTKGFLRRSKSGEVIVSPCYRDKISRHIDSFHVKYGKTNEPDYFSDSSGQGWFYRVLKTYSGDGVDFLPSLPDRSGEVAELKQRLLADIESSKYKFLEDVLEMRKTINSIRSIYIDIKNVFLRNGRLIAKLRKQGLSSEKALATIWLRIRYELRPLLISMSNLIEVAQNQVKDSQERIRIGRNHGISEQVNTIHNTISDGASWNKKYEIRALYSQNLAVGGVFENKDPIRAPLEKLGLGVKDVIPGLWAITRFSFLIDKFINISKMVYAMENLLDPSIKNRGSWNTHHTYASYEIVLLEDQCPSPYYHLSLDVSDVVIEREVIERKVWTPQILDTFPVPKLPKLETWIDIYAIFGGSFNRNMRF